MKKVFELTDEDFNVKNKMGLETVDFDIPVKLEEEHLNALACDCRRGKRKNR